MFERFTDRARRAMSLANQEAQRLGHDHIGTEHLLLGLLKEGNGVGAIVLRNRGVDLTRARQQVEQLTHPPGSRANLPNPIPYSDRYKKVIDSAVEESGKMSKHYVGTEHLLLGLLNLSDGTAAKVFTGLQLKLEDVRSEIMNLLGGGAPPAAKTTLLDQAMRDLSLHLADEQTDAAKARAVAEALVNAGWRPQQ